MRDQFCIRPIELSSLKTINYIRVSLQAIDFDLVIYNLFSNKAKFINTHPCLESSNNFAHTVQATRISIFYTIQAHNTNIFSRLPTLFLLD